MLRPMFIEVKNGLCIRKQTVVALLWRLQNPGKLYPDDLGWSN